MDKKLQKKTASPANKKLWLKLLREMPVSVNNFYGDPTIQWADTLEKLTELLKTKHLGPVSIITKGHIDDEKAQSLAYFQERGLKIIVLISISELPQFEKVGMEHRYENIKVLNKYDIPNIAYIRPMTPPYNTSAKTINYIYKKLDKVGARAIVASGFRGDDAIVGEMSPDEKIKWVMRVKIMTKDVYRHFKKNSAKYQIPLFTRTSCAVSYLFKDKITYNPYYNSPNLVHCEELSCPLRGTCQAPQSPKPGSLEFLKYLGYDLEVLTGRCGTTCKVQADNRLDCPSCCTTCFMLDVPRILVKNKKLHLGDLTFIRFVTGMLTMQPGMRDDGDKNVGLVTLPKYPKINQMQCLNSWWPYAHIGDKCFDCKYCIEKYYKSNRRDFGFAPARLLEKINL